VPALYVGKDGKVCASLFWHGFVSPLTTTGIYNDVQWHHVVVTFAYVTESLYLDGAEAAQRFSWWLEEQAYSTGVYRYALGAGFGTSWPSNSAG
jgi:hypothetical protein